MKKYLLDLSALYTDHRQKAYIGYRTSWCTVGCLIRTIRDTFRIESDLYVCSAEGIFYPESENVDLIHDGETLKILSKAHARRKRSSSGSNDEAHQQQTAATIQQESSTYEDIESVLLGLPKPKRRRVRKRKVKRTVEEEKPSQSVPIAQPNQQSALDKEQNGRVQFPEGEEPESSEEKVVDELELPYRNLNRTMKARVVRAVSPSALATQSSDGNTREPSAEAIVEVSSTANPIEGNTKPSIKARIVRALRPENTLEVKREQLEANHALLQQSYQPQTVEKDDAVIEIDYPTPVPGEEATHDTAIPAV